MKRLLTRPLIAFLAMCVLLSSGFILGTGSIKAFAAGEDPAATAPATTEESTATDPAENTVTLKPVSPGSAPVPAPAPPAAEESAPTGPPARSVVSPPAQELKFDTYTFTVDNKEIAEAQQVVKAGDTLVEPKVPETNVKPFLGWFVKVNGVEQKN